ncbi:tyrosine-type recombinase/integrase [Shewanella gaetbuli]
MSKLEEWMQYFADLLLNDRSVSLDDAIITVCHRIDEQAPILFNQNKITKKTILRDLAKPISQQATTQSELEATAHIFSCLYEFYVVHHVDLIQPKVLLPLKDERPPIDDNTPPLGVIDALKSLIFSEMPSSKKRQISNINLELADLGQTLLVVIFKSGITQWNEVKSLIQLNDKDWIVVNGQYPLISTLLVENQRRVYLFDEAILAMHKVSVTFNKLTSTQREKKLNDALVEWKAYAEHVCRHDISEILRHMSIHSLIKYISFFDRSAGLSHLWSMHTPIENHTFIRAFSGDLLQYTKKEKVTNPLISAPDSTDWQCNATYREHFEPQQIKRILEVYALQSPKQKRNTRHFNEAKTQLLTLCKSKLYWPYSLLINWITSLFINGSPWKSKLSVSTLINYYSTINRFIKVAWLNIDSQSISTSDFELYCQKGISSNKNADEQRTILRFLNFCIQHPNFPNIDTYSFELLSRASLTRSHYIAPQHFDELCQGFHCSHSTHPIPVLIVMQLCYYAGLREDEAVSLFIQDIDFDLGMIYITNRQQRKSSHAIRKVPMALIPQHILQTLAIYIEERNLSQSRVPYEERTLLEEDYYYKVEADFINSTRQQLLDESIVTHSFRHSAANNWCYLFTSIIFGDGNLASYFFSQHPLFSNEQKDRLSNFFYDCGARLSSFFHILDWVSEKLGHSNAKVTLTSYLHILDWISLVANYKPVLVSQSAIRFWTSNSSYGFERQKQLLITDEKVKKKGLINQKFLGRWIEKYWPNCNLYDVRSHCVETNKLSTESLLSFSQFSKEIEKLALGIDDHQCHLTLQNWLKISGKTPSPVLIESNQASSWLRLCTNIDIWTQLPNKKLKRMKRRLEKVLLILTQNKDVTQYRELHNLMVVYTSFNLPRLKLKVYLPSNTHSSHPWLGLFKKFNVIPVLSPTDGRAKAIAKPYGSRWPLWACLPSILRLITSYIDYSLANKSE